MYILFPAGYNAPYLSVYSENAVDVFDVNSMEWIQTIPLKKVRYLRHACHTASIQEWEIF